MASVITLSGVFGACALEKSTSAASKKGSVKLNKKTVSMKEGNRFSLKVKKKNVKKVKSVKWSSANQKIASVSAKGVVKAKKKGKTKISCKVKYLPKKSKKIITAKLKCSVTVTGKKEAAVSNTDIPSNTTAPSNPAFSPSPLPSAPAVPTETYTPSVPGVDQTNLTEEHLSKNGIKTKDNGQMRDLNSADMMKFMGHGWNNGNGMDAAPGTLLESVESCETAWGNSILTKENVDGWKKYGFNNFRIPIAWSNMVSTADGKYIIPDEFFNRVEEIMNYALDEEMYVIINIHWDNGWWGQFGSADEKVRENAWARYRSFWTQISERYKEYSDRLIFESGNEELGERLNDEITENGTCVLKGQTGTPGVLTEDEYFDMANRINQEFVNIVRASGGNNRYRYLLIAGDTHIAPTIDDRYIMPTDLPENDTRKLSVSFHYYEPWNYGGGGEYRGKNPKYTWGTEKDYQKMQTEFQSVYDKFVTKGYGVIVGEYGVMSASRENVVDYLTEINRLCDELGFVPVFWDNGLWYSRKNSDFKYDDIAEMFCTLNHVESHKPGTGKVTGPVHVETGDPEKLELKYSWEGEWIKHCNENHDETMYREDSCTEGFEVVPNYGHWYWVVMQTDWSSLQEPYIRITVDDPQDSEMELANCISLTPTEDGHPYGGHEEYNSVKYEYDTMPWNEQCIKLDDYILEELQKNQEAGLYLSFMMGVKVKKIEIFDKK